MWSVDFTRDARSYLQDLEPDIAAAIADDIFEWLADGPPRLHKRIVRGRAFFEEVVADRYLLAYLIRESTQSLLVLWIRRRPGLHATT